MRPSGKTGRGDKRTMKKKYVIAGVICTCACVICLILAWFQFRSPEPEEKPVVNTYESKIDFESLQKKNPDIYAWIEIPDTEISYPVVQNPDDDTYYLNHDAYKERYDGGALFSEHNYNGTDLEDPVTVIYGHRMNSGAMFGELQSIYSDSEDFMNHKKIIMYLPDKELTYTVFAALPYDNRHILYNYDFNTDGIYRKFFASIYQTRAIGANFNEEIDEVEPSQRVLILSTCLNGDRTQRYLVMARCDKDINKNINK